MLDGQVVEKRTEEKVERVLRVARKLFVDKGYHNVSVPAIVKASGISTGALYHYFENKEHLAREIHRETLQHFQRLFAVRLKGRTGSEEKLRAFAEVVFELTESDPEMMEYALFMKHGEFMVGSLPLCFTEPFRLIQDIVSAGMEGGEIRKKELFIQAISFTGVILRAAELRLTGVFQTSLLKAGDDFFENAWQGIKV